MLTLKFAIDNFGFFVRRKLELFYCFARFISFALFQIMNFSPNRKLRASATSDTGRMKETHEWVFVVSLEIMRKRKSCKCYSLFRTSWRQPSIIFIFFFSRCISISLCSSRSHFESTLRLCEPNIFVSAHYTRWLTVVLDFITFWHIYTQYIRKGKQMCRFTRSTAAAAVATEEIFC